MTKVKKTTAPTQMAQMQMVVAMTEIKRLVAREDPRTTTPAEISSASTVTRPICPIPLFIHIWSKSIPKAQMVSREIHQQVEEAEEDQERTHTKDLTQELKISSRLQKEKEDQLMYFAASKKCSRPFSRNTSDSKRTVHWLLQTPTRLTCTITQFSSISCNFQN